MSEEKPSKGEKKVEIGDIKIKRAENGFIYCAYPKDGAMDGSEEYVYESIDDALAAAKDDLTSPHMRGGKPPSTSGGKFKSGKEKVKEMANKAKSKEIKGNLYK